MANKKISQLFENPYPRTGDIFPIVQDGVNYKVTIDNVYRMVNDQYFVIHNTDPYILDDLNNYYGRFRLISGNLLISGDGYDANLPHSGSCVLRVYDGNLILNGSGIISGLDGGNIQLGHTSNAVGLNNINLGTSNYTTGKYNSVVGHFNKTTGDNNFIFGSGNILNSSGIIIYGLNNNTSGINNEIYGTGNTITGTEIRIYGQKNLVSGKDISIYGEDSFITGDNLHAHGHDNRLTDTNKVTIFGNHNTGEKFSSGSFIVGENNYIGNKTEAGANSLVYGDYNSVSGKNSLVYGRRNTVRIFSGALEKISVYGLENDITGIEVDVYGRLNRNDGISNQIYGQSNTGSGDANFILGEYNRIKKYAVESYVIGDWNIVNTGSGNYIAGRTNEIQAANATDIYGECIYVSGTGNWLAGKNSSYTGIEIISVGRDIEVTYQGNYSNIFGRNNRISGSGNYSDVYGTNNLNSGEKIIILGKDNTGSANSFETSIVGRRNKTFNERIFIVGENNTASGYRSYIFGQNNNNNGNYNTGTSGYIVGENNYSIGNDSFVIGKNNVLTGDSSAVFGYGNNTTITATRTHVFGIQNVVSGRDQVVVGSGNKNSGVNSMVVGYDNTNAFSGTDANVFGRGNYSNANRASIYGSGNLISGDDSSTYGYRNQILQPGTRSHIFGYENISFTRNETILGSGNLNSGVDSWIVGYGNRQRTGTYNYIIGNDNTLNDINTGSAIFGNQNIIASGLTGVSIYGNQITLPLSGNAGYKLTQNNMNGAIQIGANNSGKITILYNGNIGIGTSGTLPFENPQELVHLRSGNALFDATEGGYFKFYDKYRYDNTPDNPSERAQPGDIRAIVSGGNFKIDGDLIISTGVGETGQFLAGRIFQEATVRSLDGTMWCYSVSDINNNCAQPQTITTGTFTASVGNGGTSDWNNFPPLYLFTGLSGVEILPNSFLRIATRGGYGGYYAQWEASPDGSTWTGFDLFLFGTINQYPNANSDIYPLNDQSDFTGLFPPNAKYLRLRQPAGGAGGGQIIVNVTGQIGATFYNTTYPNNTEIITGTDGIPYTHKTGLWQPYGFDFGWDTPGSATLSYASGYDNGYAQTINIKEGAIAQPDFCNVDCNYDYQPHEYGRLSGRAIQFLDGNDTRGIISGRYTFLHVPIMKTTNLYLPSAYQNSGALYTVKNLGKGNIMVFPSGNDKIDLFFTGFMIDQRFASYEFLSNGSGWFLV